MNYKTVIRIINISFLIFFTLNNISEAAHISVVNWRDGGHAMVSGDIAKAFDLVIDNMDTTSNIPVPECVNGCTLGIAFRNGDGENVGSMLVSLPHAVVYGSTVGELESNFLKENKYGAPPITVTGFGLVYTGASRYLYDTGACFYFGYIPDTNIYWSGYGLFGIKAIGGSICTPLPMSTVTCNITSPSVDIDHGALSEKEIEGNKKSKTINIACDGKSTINISLDSTDVDLQGGVSSHLELSSSQLNANNGNNTETITSTLHKSGSVSTGLHKNAGVVLRIDWS